MLNKSVLVHMVVTFIYFSKGAKILGIVPTASYSHHVQFNPLWRELSLRGHQVTTITTDPINDSNLVNLTEINLHFSYKIWNEHLPSIVSSNSLLSAIKVIEIITLIGDKQLEHPEVQNLIKNKSEHFDLVMIESSRPLFFAFAERFKCPLIAITSLDAWSRFHSVLGNPTHPILYPDYWIHTEDHWPIIERALNVFYTYSMLIYDYWYLLPMGQSVVEKHFGKHYPSIMNMARQTSLLFVSTDPVLHKSKPMLPTVVQIGGLHRIPSKPLQGDVKEVLDNATEGFIYVSLGTNVKNTDISVKLLNILKETFADIPYTVLWKYEMEKLPEKPKNVIVSKWFPQLELLRHPNIKLFITHGGLQSLYEAIHYKVPILGIPFFADQPSNIKQMVSKGCGLSLNIKTLEKENFKQTILEVIHNQTYRNEVKKLAKLGEDQPMTGLERAIWWTEYVLRHKGAKHLRSHVMDIPTYQYYLLDVLAIIGITLIVLISILLFTLKLLLRFIKYTVLTNANIKQD